MYVVSFARSSFGSFFFFFFSKCLMDGERFFFPIGVNYMYV